MIEEDSRQLAEPLRAAVQSLRSRGNCDSATLSTQMRDLASRIERLGESARTVSIRHPHLGTRTDTATSTLDGLREQVGKMRRSGLESASHERRRRAAIRTCGLILSLRTVDETPLLALDVCQSEAARWRHRLTVSHNGAAAPEAEITEFLAGTHPLFGVAKLMEGSEQLDDDSWAALLEQIERHYGRALSTAISRQRLVVGVRSE